MWSFQSFSCTVCVCACAYHPQQGHPTLLCDPHTSWVPGRQWGITEVIGVICTGLGRHPEAHFALSLLSSSLLGKNVQFPALAGRPTAGGETHSRKCL